MSLPTRYLIASAAFAAFTIAGASAYAEAAKPETRSEVRIIHGDGGVQVIRDGKTVVMTRGDDRRTDRAEHLRAVLQLRPNQEAALAAYVQALKPPEIDAKVLTGADNLKTTPERLAAQEKMLTEQVAQMRARLEATRRFYDQLDAPQKRAFDELNEGPTIMMRQVRFAHPAPPPRPPLPPGPPAPPRGL